MKEHNTKEKLRDNSFCIWLRVVLNVFIKDIPIPTAASDDLATRPKNVLSLGNS